MRQLQKEEKSSLAPAKILIISILITIAAASTIYFLNIGKYVLKGPQTAFELITNSGIKSDNGRTNILLLGTGGEGHDGPNLTDTIILASIDKDGKDPALVSIPRDLWAPSVKAKINAAYAFGQEKNGKGKELAAKTISELFGIPIHYTVRVDFNGFTEAVDLIDGLDINVDKSFQDPMYPIPGKENDLCKLTIEMQEINGQKLQVVKTATGSAIPLFEINDRNTPFVCRYETLDFEKGPKHMDGETALKFVRSRHGTNDEGTDFARSARQQKVILAFRDKVFSTQTFTSPKTIIDLITTFDKSIDTDIQNDDIALFLKLVKKIDTTKIRTIVLDSEREESQLIEGDPVNYGGQFVLEPKDGTWQDFAEYVQGEIFKLQEK